MPTTPSTASITTLSGSELARQIRSGDLSPLQVVEAHIERIEAVNPALNAVVQTRYEAARREARQAEERLTKRRKKSSDLPPFLGVPFTVKEFYPVEGLPNTGGLPARAHHRSKHDCVVVRRMKATGAILLGVTNAPEGGLWSETNNRVYGRTNNPWDLKRTPGGSSGGEAAIIAAGGVPFGIGSDIGGSIRIPSALCGTFGHKPTGRMVPTTDHFPAMKGTVGRMLSCGPIARHVDDLYPLLSAIAGPDGVDPNCSPIPLRPPHDVRLQGLKVLVMEPGLAPRLHPSVKAALHRAARHLEARGATLHFTKAPSMYQVVQMWSTALDLESGGTGYSQLMSTGERVRLRRELPKYLTGRSDHITAAMAIFLLERLLKGVPEQSRTHWLDAGRKIQVELEAEMGAHGVILCPTYPRTAPRHHDMLRRPLDFVPTALFNVTEFPVTQVPAGFDERGLPIGLQVASSRGHDHLTLRVGKALEEDMGGWVKAMND